MRPVKALACGILALAGASSPTRYDIYAVRFATVRDFHARNFLLHADSTRTFDVAFIFWVLRPEGSANRAILFDAGFYRDKFLASWKPVAYQRPPMALSKVGIAPDAVTDVVISHVHWDHLDGVDLFPHARIWIQKAEYEHYIDAEGRPTSGTIDTADAAMLARLRQEGRVTLINGDAKEIMPGITVYTGGRHTYASQYLGVRTASGTAVLASDNAYTYENLDRHIPIAQTFAPSDTIANLQAQDRMRRIATDPRLIVPGHDPEIFVRYPTPGDGVARIE